jgi:hypothetical protein
MALDPTNLSTSSLPPVAMPARACAFATYQEVLLSTDANGNAAIMIIPTMNGMYNVCTQTAPGVITTGTPVSANEYASFTTNYSFYVPTVMEATASWTGSALNTAGRFYGIVGPTTISGSNPSNYPQEAFGCEALAGDGISCVWYSTQSVWDTPQVTNASSTPTQWLGCAIVISIMGAPVSVANAISVGIYLHFAAMPNTGVCGLSPAYSLPDPSMAMAMGMLSSLQDGPAKSATALTDRARQRRKYKGVLRDVLNFGAQAAGTLLPVIDPALPAIHHLINLIG